MYACMYVCMYVCMHAILFQKYFGFFNLINIRSRSHLVRSEINSMVERPLMVHWVIGSIHH